MLLMKTILETTQLQFETGEFLIDLVQDAEGQLTVEVLEGSLHSGIPDTILELTPAKLVGFLKVFHNYLAQIPAEALKGIAYRSSSDEVKIQRYYLKGISIEAIAQQMDYSRDLVAIILKNKGFELVETKPPKRTNWKYKRKRR